MQFHPGPIPMKSVGGSGWGLCSESPIHFHTYICITNIFYTFLCHECTFAVSKGIVDAHGGLLSVYSAGEGRGSTFTIELPIEPPTVTPNNTAPVPNGRSCDDHLSPISNLAPTTNQSNVPPQDVPIRGARLSSFPNLWRRFMFNNRTANGSPSYQHGTERSRFNIGLYRNLSHMTHSMSGYPNLIDRRITPTTLQSKDRFTPDNNIKSNNIGNNNNKNQIINMNPNDPDDQNMNNEKKFNSLESIHGSSKSNLNMPSRQENMEILVDGDQNYSNEANLLKLLDEKDDSGEVKLPSSSSADARNGSTSPRRVLALYNAGMGGSSRSIMRSNPHKTDGDSDGSSHHSIALHIRDHHMRKQLDSSMHRKLDTSIPLEDSGKSSREVLMHSTMAKSIDGNMNKYHKYGRVLIVDDVAMNRKMLRRILESRFDEVDEADDGQDAVNILRVALAGGQSSPYQLITMDYQMPVMDGVTATRIIRQLGYEGAIVAVTGNAYQADVDNFLTSGANAAMTKPLNVKEFDAFLASYFV